MNIGDTFTKVSYRSFTACIIYRNMDTFIFSTKRRIINGKFTNYYRNRFNGRYAKRFMNRFDKRIMNTFMGQNIDTIRNRFTVSQRC